MNHTFTFTERQLIMIHWGIEEAIERWNPVDPDNEETQADLAILKHLDDLFFDAIYYPEQP